MSLQSVEAARQNVHASPDALRAAVTRAHRAGIPVSKIARAAGVSRTTIYTWLKDAPAMSAASVVDPVTRQIHAEALLNVIDEVRRELGQSPQLDRLEERIRQA